MEAKDIDAVLDLLKRYLAKFDMAPIFTREEVDHWFLPKKDAPDDQVVWSYVVEVSLPQSPRYLLIANESRTQVPRKSPTSFPSPPSSHPS
jgi:hypothetical protein